MPSPPEPDASGGGRLARISTMSPSSEAKPTRHGTIGVYDAPRWWRTRRFWRLALPIVAAVASLGIWYAILA